MTWCNETAIISFREYISLNLSPDNAVGTIQCVSITHNIQPRTYLEYTFTVN